MQNHSVGACGVCMGYGQVPAGERRRWCPQCGGSGKHLLYEELVACDECIGDGACIACGGEEA